MHAALDADRVRALLAGRSRFEELHALGPDVLPVMARLYETADPDARATIAAAFYRLGWPSDAEAWLRAPAESAAGRDAGRPLVAQYFYVLLWLDHAHDAERLVLAAIAGLGDAGRAATDWIERAGDAARRRARARALRRCAPIRPRRSCCKSSRTCTSGWATPTARCASASTAACSGRAEPRCGAAGC